MSLLFFPPKQFRFDPEKVDLDTNFDSRYDREPIPKDLGYFFFGERVPTKPKPKPNSQNGISSKMLWHQQSTR